MMPQRYLDKERTIVDRVQGTRVLHLGCIGATESDFSARTTALTNSLHAALDSVARVTGVDHARDVIAFCHDQRLFRDVRHGDIGELKNVLAADETFDYIIAADVIEHLSNPGQFLAQLPPYLAPGGALIITTPNAFGVLNQLRYGFGRFRESRDHVTVFNIWGLENLLARFGYHIEDVATCYQPHARTFGFGFLVGRFIFRFAPRFGGTLLVVCRHGQAAGS